MQRTFKITLASIALFALGFTGGFTYGRITSRTTCPYSDPEHKTGTYLQIVADGLEQYKVKHGNYPEFTDFQSMVSSNSSLVRENLIPVGLPADKFSKHTIKAHSNQAGFIIVWHSHFSLSNNTELLSTTP